MSEPPDPPEDLADDTVVLGGVPEPPPRSGPRLGRRGRWIAIGLAVALVATVAWLNRPVPAGTGPISDDPRDPGARTQPLYPGAVGRLLFTVPEAETPQELTGERTYALWLGTSAIEAGTLLPPVGTDRGFPAGPGVPPHRAFALGPEGTPAAGLLAFLGDGPPVLSAPRFAYVLDVSNSGLHPLPAPVGEASALTWSPDGELLLLRNEPTGEVVLEGLRPDGPRREIARLPATMDRGLAPVYLSGRLLILLEEAAAAFATPPRIRVVSVEGNRVRTLLRGYEFLGTGPDGLLLQAFGGVARFVWSPGEAPRRLEGFLPGQILGWTADRLHYAALGNFHGVYGLWFVRWPNTPVFQLDDLEVGGVGVGPVAFSGDGAAAFYVKDIDLWMVEIGSERARRLPLPGDAARRVPSGPLVWVP